MATKPLIPEGVPAPGTMAPDFELPSDSGEMVRLSEFRGRRVVLYFYPKDMTSGCTAQACGFRDSYQLVEERDAVVLAVSPDGVESHRRFRAKYDLPFHLLADVEHKVAEAYGVWGEKSLYGKKYFGVTRSHFVIDLEGRIADVQYKVSPADSVSLALEELKLT